MIEIKWDETFDEVEEGRDWVLEAFIDGKPAGTLRVYKDSNLADRGHITASDISVKSEFQRKGVATELYDKAEELTGCTMISALDYSGEEEFMTEDAHKFWENRCARANVDYKDLDTIISEAVLDKFVLSFGDMIDTNTDEASGYFEAVSTVTSAIVEAKDYDFRKEIQKEVKDELDQKEEQWDRQKEIKKTKIDKFLEEKKLKKSKEGLVRVPIFIDGRGMILEQLEENFPEVIKNADQKTWRKLADALENMELLVDLDPKTGEYIPVKFRDNIDDEEIVLK